MSKLFIVFILFIFVSVPVLSYAGPFVATSPSDAYTVQKLQNKDIKKSSSPFVATSPADAYTIQKLQNKGIKCTSHPIVATDWSNAYAVQSLTPCI